jgi:uncharacterized RDD family membrane protein YckC
MGDTFFIARSKATEKILQDYRNDNPSFTHDENRIGQARLENVRTRRVLAFIVDYLLVAMLSLMAGVVVFFLGFFTFGLAWLLYFVLPALVAIFYVATTMGGPNQATLGMQFFALKIYREDGGNIDPYLAILHSVMFWVAHIVLTPFMLALSLFSSKKRLVQDMLLGTVILRSDV